MTSLSRRGLIAGLISLVAAPAIVRAGSLMPVKQMVIVSFDPAYEYDQATIPIKTIYWQGYGMWITGNDIFIHCESLPAGVP